MVQTDLYNWGHVKDQINTRRRIDWASILGKTLTERITELSIEGYNSEMIYKIIKSELLKNGYDEVDVFRRLKISVCARCGEQKAHSNRINKAR